MVVYTIEGYYNIDSKLGEIQGEIDVSPNDFGFEGEITDMKSGSPHQFIKGHFYEEGIFRCMLFIKYPQNPDMKNFFFDLYKNVPRGGIDGEYRGDWSEVPYMIDVRENYDIVVAELDLSSTGFGGFAMADIIRK